ncbi:hypothetical protein H310_02706 [Aphanomyces invadans]|uniref:Uncharacterized protein n=1 Tax=Aphanomyces invadans TaxID=157072 RepID=A0A024UJX0_9STRA|nr:hypothetical protein H310_02706 [Aphanomyces invadans]ETW06450.1 hypothetical protein H310_02706 [Aphanomyces invadans]|eukprot:XP_008864525.1 hypothetical protein H310_02706 [Aphanomyces invadans]
MKWARDGMDKGAIQRDGIQVFPAQQPSDCRRPCRVSTICKTQPFSAVGRQGGCPRGMDAYRDHRDLVVVSRRYCHLSRCRGRGASGKNCGEGGAPCGCVLGLSRRCFGNAKALNASAVASSSTAPLVKTPVSTVCNA